MADVGAVCADPIALSLCPATRQGCELRVLDERGKAIARPNLIDEVYESRLVGARLCRSGRRRQGSCDEKEHCEQCEKSGTKETMFLALRQDVRFGE